MRGGLGARGSAAVHRSRARRRRRKRTWASSLHVRLGVGVFAVALVVLVLGFVFAGSPAHLAEGTRIAGVDVGGLTPTEARAQLERRSAQLAGVPVTFTAGTKQWRLKPKQLGVEVDWGAAVAAAERQGAGFGPVRGYRRLELRFFDVDLEPP